MFELIATLLKVDATQKELVPYDYKVYCLYPSSIPAGSTQAKYYPRIPHPSAI
jgi:hypothetical protein